MSFGTSYNDSRDLTIGAIEEAIAEAYPDYDVRRAFTSQIIIDKLAERDGLDIDNVQKALDRAVEDGVKTLIVQPTHLMNGLEYTDVVEEVAQYADQFDAVRWESPCLPSDADYEAVIQAITEATADYDDGKRPSALWDTAPRRNPTAFTPRCRRNLRKPAMRTTSWVR